MWEVDEAVFGKAGCGEENGRFLLPNIVPRGKWGCAKST